MIFSVWLGNIDVNNRDHLVGRPTRARGEVDLSDIFSMVGRLIFSMVGRLI